MFGISRELYGPKRVPGGLNFALRRLVTEILSFKSFLTMKIMEKHPHVELQSKLCYQLTNNPP